MKKLARYLPLVFFLAGCSPPDIAERMSKVGEGVPLVDGFTSMMRANDVSERITASAGGAQVPQFRSAQGSDLLSESSLKVEEFVLLGYPGSARFDFFYDRLGRIVFSPRNYDGFVAKLKANGSADKGSHVRVALNANTVVWLDERLMEAIRPGYR